MLDIDVGGVTRQAQYVSGSGTATLTFSYTTQAGDTSSDLEYAGTDALSLSGGTLLDASGNAADLILPTPGTTGSLGFTSSTAIDTSSMDIFSGSVNTNTITLTYVKDLDITQTPDLSHFILTKNG